MRVIRFALNATGRLGAKKRPGTLAGPFARVLIAKPHLVKAYQFIPAYLTSLARQRGFTFLSQILTRPVVARLGRREDAVIQRAWAHLTHVSIC